MPKLLGIQLANGYSPEASVFAALLGHRANAYDALILHHDWPGDSQSVPRFEAHSGIRVNRFDMGWRPNPDGTRPLPAKVVSVTRACLTLSSLLRAARAYEPDVVYSNQQRWDCSVASFLAARLRKPQIIHLHYNIGPFLHRHPLRRLRTCDHVVVISDFIYGQALRHGVPPDRLTRIHNAIPVLPVSSPDVRADVRAELSIPQDAEVIGIVGRLSQDKGQSDTIAAFASIAAQFPAARLVVVGAGMELPNLTALASATGYADRILFTGFRNDVPRLLTAFDLFAHPSRNEPFGLAMAEASAAALPVVAYAEGGTCEVVADGETGILTPVGDTTELARAFARLLADPALAKRMGAAGRERIATCFQPAVAGRAFAELIRRFAA